MSTVHWPQVRWLMVGVVGLSVLLAAVVFLSASWGGGATAASAETGEKAPPQVGPEILARLEAASRDYAACGQALGYTARVLPGDGLRRSRVSFSVPDVDGVPDAETVQASREALTRCRTELDVVEADWERQRPEPTSQDLEVFYSRLEACVSGGGGSEVAGPLDYPFVHFGKYKNAPNRSIPLGTGGIAGYGRCARSLEAETGIVAPPPREMSPR